MRNSCCWFWILLCCAPLWSMAQTGNIILQNQQLRFEISQEAIPLSLIHKASGKELLSKECPAPLFGITQMTPYDNEWQLTMPARETYFAANSINPMGDQFEIRFEKINVVAVVSVQITDAFIGFELDSIKYDARNFGDTKKTPIDRVTLMNLPIKNLTNFGSLLNVAWDDEIAVAVVGTDQYTKIGSSDARTHTLLLAEADASVQLEKTGAALVVSSKNNFLPSLQKLEEAYKMPAGVGSRLSPDYLRTYIEPVKLDSSNLESYLQFAESSGIGGIQIFWPDFAASAGHFPFRKNYPNGITDLRSIVNRIKSKGISAGLHIHYNKADKNDPYVTPVPDHRLNLRKGFTLAKSINATDSIIEVEENPSSSSLDEGRRILRIGNELIEYRSYTRSRPFKFIGCRRGILNTNPLNAEKGTMVGLLDVDTWNIFVRFNQESSIQDEVAKRIGDIYDGAGFEFIYYDGAEDVPPPYWHNVAASQLKVHKQIKRSPVFSEGAAKSHYSWHLVTRGNAFDIFEPEYIKQAINKYAVYAASVAEKDFTAVNFGWIEFRTPDSMSLGLQSDMVEYVYSKATGWKSAVSFIIKLKQLKEHPRINDLTEVIRRWETVRQKNLFTSLQARSLKDSTAEHFLFRNEKNQLELIPYKELQMPAGLNNSIRMFHYKRDGRSGILFWHTRGLATISIPAIGSVNRVFSDLDHRDIKITRKGSRMLLKAGDRLFWETDANESAINEAINQLRIR